MFSEIGPFLKDNLLPGDIGASVTVVSWKLFTLSFHCTAVLLNRVSSLAFILLFPFKFTAFEALQDIHHPSFHFFGNG